MRCNRCGNETPEGNRFCGMCGMSLLPASAEAPGAAKIQPPKPVPVPPTESIPQKKAPEAPKPATEPIISGPSFLGLNEPATPPKGRARLSIEPHGQGSRNVDYLLEDEEPKGGKGKFVLIVLVLAVAVGAGYVALKNHSLPWSASNAGKPTAATPSAEDQDHGPAAQAPAGASPAPTDQAVQPVGGPAAPNTPAATVPAGAAAVEGTGTGAEEKPAPPSAAQPPAGKDTGSAGSKPASSVKATKAAKARAAAKERPAKAPATAQAKTGDPVREAQRYIYGRGVKQDCDRGMRLLKPAAEQANPRAMVELGALYSAGLCAPRDLPTSYRWFALALRKEPDNQAIQTDLKKLWGEMTQPERQLAIKLSQ